MPAVHDLLTRQSGQEDFKSSCVSFRPRGCECTDSFVRRKGSALSDRLSGPSENSPLLQTEQQKRDLIGRYSTLCEGPSRELNLEC